jgi:hypothetical protein
MIPNRKKYVDEHTEIRRRKWREYGANNREKRSQYNKKYKEKNREILLAKGREYKRIYREKYPEKIRECKIKSYHKHREYYRKYSKEYQIKNKEKYLQYLSNYRLINKERLKQKRLIYCATRRKIISQKQYIYKKKKLKTDPYFKLMENLRSRIYCVLKGRIKKSARTLKLLDVKNISEVKQHLEKQFKDGMTWGNHGKWHIDHIKPCASFDLRCPIGQLDCFHYTNLQPLWAYDNLSKNDKLLDLPSNS